MMHPSDDTLLLLAYGEVPPAESADLEHHVARCEPCRLKFVELERARAALDVALPARRPTLTRWAVLALAAAAALTAVVIIKSGPARDSTERWAPMTSWSATAGYVTGGKAMVDLDDQLTRLERERYYGLPD